MNLTIWLSFPIIRIQLDPVDKSPTWCLSGQLVNPFRFELVRMTFELDGNLPPLSYRKSSSSWRLQSAPLKEGQQCYARLDLMLQIDQVRDHDDIVFDIAGLVAPVWQSWEHMGLNNAHRTSVSHSFYTKMARIPVVSVRDPNVCTLCIVNTGNIWYQKTSVNAWKLTSLCAPV